VTNAKTPTIRNTETAASGEGDWVITVDSVGTASAKIVAALSPVIGIDKALLARLIFQAPSVLLDGLSENLAVEANSVLLGSGLETSVRHQSAVNEPGKGDHEIALVVRDVGKMSGVLVEVVNLLGVSVAQARAMLCASPAILIGKISTNSVAACRERFKPFGVELDVTLSKDALYDVFLGPCAKADRQRVQKSLREFGVDVPNKAEDLIVQMGLSNVQAEKLWANFARSPIPLRLISRDFERFDVTLDSAPNTPEMQAFLVTATGMPPAVAARIIERAPFVLAELCSFDQMQTYIAQVDTLGGTATGHLTLFQNFELNLRKVGDLKKSADVLATLADYTPKEAIEILGQRKLDKPFSHLQARWVQNELRLAGTETDRVLL